MTRLSIVVLVAGASVAGCGDDQQPPPEPIEEAPPEQQGPGAFAVHEWGLLDVVLADGTAELAAGPGDPVAAAAPAADPAAGTVAPAPSNIDRESAPTAGTTMSVGRRKPVLYVHLVESSTEATFSLSIATSPGHVVEHWPPAQASEGGITWPQVVARAGACELAAFPSAQDARCASVEDGYCEAAELSGYVTEDGACLTVDGNQYDHLFYRGAGPGPELPFSPRLDGTTMKASWGATIRPVGTLLRVTRDDAGVRVTSMAAEECDDVAELAMPRDGDGIDDAKRAVSATLRQLGLSEAEAEAFERAWMDELFGQRGAIADAFLYFLPPELVQPMASLTFDPAPVELRRVFLVRVDLSSP